MYHKAKQLSGFHQYTTEYATTAGSSNALMVVVVVVAGSSQKRKKVEEKVEQHRNATQRNKED